MVLLFIPMALLNVMQIFPLLLFCSITADCYIVPVLLWKNGNGDPAEHISGSMKSEISREDFRNVLAHELEGNPTVVVFAEESLKHENFLERAEDGEALFPRLRSLVSPLKHVVYLPGVESPLLEFRRLEKLKWRFMALRKGSSTFAVPVRSRTSLFLILDSAAHKGSTELLRRHDDIIVNTYTTMTEHLGTVLAIYTSIYPFWFTGEQSHFIRGAKLQSKLATDGPNPTLFHNDGIMVFSSSSPVLRFMTHSHTEDLLLENSSTIQYEEHLLLVDAPRNEMNVRHLEFHYATPTEHVWVLSKVVVTPKSDLQNASTLMTAAHLVLDTESSSVESFAGLSYHCSLRTVFADGEQGVQLIFRDIQTQPFLKNKMRFAAALDCTPFFTAGIIVVTCLALLYVGALFLVLGLMSTVQGNREFESPNEPRLVIKRQSFFDTK